jgi:hypothetical protein
MTVAGAKALRIGTRAVLLALACVSVAWAGQVMFTPTAPVMAEPTALLLLGSGLVTVGVLRKKKQE